MKKKILSGIFALSLLVATGYGVSQNLKSDSGLSNLALNNVEALAQSENDQKYKYVFPGADPTVKCVCSGSGSKSCC